MKTIIIPSLLAGISSFGLIALIVAFIVLLVYAFQIIIVIIIIIIIVIICNPLGMEDSIGDYHGMLLFYILSLQWEFFPTLESLSMPLDFYWSYSLSMYANSYYNINMI